MLKAGAAGCSPSPERVPLQKVPSNLEIALAESGNNDGGYAMLTGIVNMPGQSDHFVPECVTSEAGRAEDAVSPTERADDTGDSIHDSANGVLSDGSIAEEREIVPSEAGEAARQGLGKAKRVLWLSNAQTEEGVQSEVPTRALKAGARRVECSAGEELEGGEDGAEAEQEKEPLAWFPRAKKDSFLERKIKKMQESEGPKEHLGEAFVKKMSRVEREKAAAATAAEAALAAKKAALVEVSWCRILEAASIPCDAAAVRARAAESRASETASAAAALGVVLSPAASGRPHSAAPKTAARGYRDVIFASTASEADVEREVVGAVKSALRRAELTSAGEGELPGAENGPEMTSAALEGAEEPETLAGEATGDGQQSAEAGGNGTPASPSTPVTGTVPRAAPPVDSDVSPFEKNGGVTSYIPGKSPGAKAGGEAEPRSPPKAKTGSRFGGLLMACISPRGKDNEDSEGEDSSSEEEGEDNGLLGKDALKKDGVSASGFAGEDEGLAKDGAGTWKEVPLAADFSPGSSSGRPRKAATRYSSALEASDSDDEGGHVAFSPSRSLAFASPGKVHDSAREQPEPDLEGAQKAASPGEEVTGGGTTRQGEKSVEELVEAMVGRLAGLSAEQRAAVGSVVATRGFGGFMESSPLTSRLAGITSPQKPSGLGDDFLIKRSKLEVAKDEATAAAKTATANPPKMGSFLPSLKVSEPGLDQILVKRLSKLELAKAASKAEAEKNAPANVVKKENAGQSGLAEPGLDQVLVKRMSKLEMAKAEAVAASKAESERGAPANRAKRNTAGQDGLAEPGLDQVLVKRMSKLEKAKADAAEAAKADSEQDGKVVKGRVEVTQNGTNSDFGRDLVKHVSKLERAKADAAAAAKLELSGSAGRKNGTAPGTEPELGLGQVLVKRLSKLEQAKADAVAAAQSAPATPGKPAKLIVDPNPHAGGLGDMVKRPSRLEREKEAARKAAESADDLTPTTVLSRGFKDEGLGATGEGFGQGFVKKMSRLEREKAAAQEQGLGVSAAARAERPKQDAAAWEGQGLGTLKKHMSRLEREKLAWKDAEEAAKAH
ncbi:hypothetical protein KFL_002290160 [Klebsormidium nitens]|uniref:Uncharacterized protein n=1 Tax=Klebsormidium nitens TaxID=105231 RepID=A0A1Y1I9F4_KLENI|nr:hypothetical protein KFL_002290160 [Klebsormidium nitens]|eukprot:GAQ85326.1 hypothetical protein KFL_002290160 [Klebsormidium nitens]